MKPSRLFLFVMALTVVSMVLASCVVPPAAPAQPAAPAEPAAEQPAAEQPAAAVPADWKAGVAVNAPDLKGKELVIYDVPKLIGIDYFAATAQGMQDAANELGNVQVTTDAPTEAKIEKQIEFLDNFITKNPSVLMYASNDPVAIAPVLRKALDKGIHVVGYDADAEENAREFFVNQVDFKDFGYALADEVARQAGEDAKVAIVTSSLTAPNQNTWIGFIKERMQTEYPNMTLLDTRPSEEDQNLAFTVTQDLMKAYPEMNAVIGMSSVAFPGAADAVSQAGKCADVKVIGASTPKAMKKFVNDGCIETVVLWNPVDLDTRLSMRRAPSQTARSSRATRSSTPASSASCRSPAARSCWASRSSSTRTTSTTSTSSP
jgi:ABC-type sugar transport system substrate-binding protein